MKLKLSNKSVIVFDLDDTLFKEIEYLKSAYKYIAEEVCSNNSIKLYKKMLDLYYSGNNAFNYLIENYPEKSKNVDYLLELYRNHYPNITLEPEINDFLLKLIENKIILGIITDGRSNTQRNKLKALGIEKQFNYILISEEFGYSKPNELNYKLFMQKFPDKNYIYIADNIKKDFITPNKLGWLTICLLDDGRNIHKQSFNYEKEYLPKELIKSFSELEIVYE
ncbi:MAG TPA: HAD family hydrolase [Melioribacteraceae bacterium]|nr:HAD family hydrolase [Melioribacteraceae bacterium]